LGRFISSFQGLGSVIYLGLPALFFEKNILNTAAKNRIRGPKTIENQKDKSIALANLINFSTLQVLTNTPK
jgi:hypothetical protein